MQWLKHKVCLRSFCFLPCACYPPWIESCTLKLFLLPYQIFFWKVTMFPGNLGTQGKGTCQLARGRCHCVGDRPTFRNMSLLFSLVASNIWRTSRYSMQSFYLIFLPSIFRHLLFSETFYYYFFLWERNQKARRVWLVFVLFFSFLLLRYWSTIQILLFSEILTGQNLLLLLRVKFEAFQELPGNTVSSVHSSTYCSRTYPIFLLSD